MIDGPDGDLFDDALIAIMGWDEKAFRESDYSLRLPRFYSEQDVRVRWDELSDTFVDGYGRILNQFYGFPPGTDREEIWEAFEEAGLEVVDAINYDIWEFYPKPWMVKEGR